MFGKKNKKKQVIAYLHTHWDREWYREFEVFRLRLLKVFDNVLELLKNGDIPSFYFDGQVCALLDYLEFRPDNEQLVRQLIQEKKLFIGPFYCLIDEFLTDEICFRKNLEIGIKIAKDFGCSDFIGYFADTFGHSQNTSRLLEEFGIDKAVVWRGVPDDLPSEFIFNGIDTVNLVRGYYMDIFSSEKSMEEKAQYLSDNLDLIAEKSKNTILLPIGADHLGIPCDIAKQIEEVNAYLDKYEIRLGSLFDYFECVKFKKKYNGELRDNSQTFVLPGAYSARMKLKQCNVLASYKLDLANKLSQGKYDSAIEYAYKLLLKNQAHDSICGCSTDETHQECITRYKKILQIANTIIDEISVNEPDGSSVSFEYPAKYKILEFESSKLDPQAQLLSTSMGFPKEILYDISKIPVTEDYTTIYRQIKEFNSDEKKSDIHVIKNEISNSNIRLEVYDGKINLYHGSECFENFIEFVRYNDLGDTYNFGPDKNDNGEVAKIKYANAIMVGELRSAIKIETSFFSVVVSLDKLSQLLRFKIKWTNFKTNQLLQVRFNLPKNITTTLSEDLNTLITRKFSPEYDIRQNLPNSKGKEAKTNTAPMQRFVWANGFGVITKGLSEYEVFKNSLSVTLLRSIGVISNPKNPARTTPAGPPIKVYEAQQLGENTAEFAIGFFDVEDWQNYVEEIYPQTLLF